VTAIRWLIESVGWNSETSIFCSNWTDQNSLYPHCDVAVGCTYPIHLQLSSQGVLKHRFYRPDALLYHPTNTASKHSKHRWSKDYKYKKTELSQRWPCNAPYIWVPWKFSRVPEYANGYFSRNF